MRWIERSSKAIEINQFETEMHPLTADGRSKEASSPISKLPSTHWEAVPSLMLLKSNAAAGAAYSAFTFKAAVDWVDVRVTLPAPSQPRHVRSRIPAGWGKPPYVTAETEAPSRTATVFSFRVQDPIGPSRLMANLQCIVQPGQSPLTESDVEVVGIEVAFDAYSVEQDRSALARMTEAMLWRQTLCASHPRVTSKVGSLGIATKLKVRRVLDNEGSFNAGDVDSDFSQRWYLKDYNSLPGKPYQTLPISEHRARSEATLRGGRLPFKTMAGWREFKFETLRTPYFSWRLSKDMGMPERDLPLWMLEFPRLGLVTGAEKRRQDRRKTNPGTRPDIALQQAAKNALERLTRQQRRG